MVFFLCAILTGITLIGTFVRVSKKGYMDLVDWFIGALGVFNGMGYALVIWASNIGLNPYWASWILQYSEYYWAFPMLSLVVAVSVWGGAILYTKINRRRVPVNENIVKEVTIYKQVGWIFLFLGIFAYWIYAREYGGFINLLSYSDIIRSGLIGNINIYNPWTWLQRLGGLSFFSSLLFYGLLLNKSSNIKSGRASNILGFVVSVCFSLYVLYSWLARVNIISYIVIFPLGYAYYRYFRYLEKGFSLRVALLSILIVIALPFLSLRLTPAKYSKNLLDFYVKELSFPAVSFFVATDYKFRLGQDLLIAPVYLFPQRIWRNVFGIDSASDINTERIYGYRQGESGITGGVPTDIVTFCYMQLGIIGISIINILLGIGLVWLERLIKLLPNIAFRAVIYSYSAIMISTLTVLYADPLHIIQRNFSFIIGLITIFLVIIIFRRRPIQRFRIR